MNVRTRVPEREVTKVGAAEHSRYVSPRPTAEPKRKKEFKCLEVAVADPSTSFSAGLSVRR